MARQTSIVLRNKTIYQVFVRQHSKTHDFKGLIADLDRIKDLGIDIVYLLPIHPIGLKDRKGEVGSPYAIYDYYEIAKENGSLDDFKLLVDEVHKRGMKLMIDIVFNHTSRDSILTQKHPEWFYHKPDGSFANRVGDWSDITDFDFSNREVWDYLIDVLKYWAQYADGFRCDVAPLLPLDFWLEARSKLDQIRPDLIWLTESVHVSFVKYLRDSGYDASSDSMVYQAFDIAYDYDIFDFMIEYLDGKITLERWMYEFYRQEGTYPKNYVKLRSFENHDQERIASRVNDPKKLIQLTALQFFLKGTPMIYAGQEHQVKKRPDLFEYDEVPWNKENSIEPFLKTLIHLKKDKIFSEGVLDFVQTKDIAVLKYHLGNDELYGIFNLENIKEIDLDLPDGIYQNLLSNSTYTIKNKKLILKDEPIYLRIRK
jgi:cyclomaltodextrinase